MKALRSLSAVLFSLWIVAGGAYAGPLPGGTLDPLTIPKYVTPLVIPPVMNDGIPGNTVQDRYDIAVRQFKQQILPGGIWDTVADPADLYPNFPPTTVWSYGPVGDEAPDSSALGGGPGIAPAANSQFNYPAYTIETTSMTPVNVRWINDLKENFGAGPGFLPHLLPVDQTLHWANPSGTGCADGSNTTDCATNNPALYTGPVPIVTHVHGAHVDPHSDGYPEAWWLPAGVAGFVSKGSFFDDATGVNPGNLGYADYSYRNDQPATTLWYHDHALGMTRANVYAGPAGFWLVRGGAFDGVADGVTGGAAVLPGPAPAAGQTVLQLNTPNPVRNSIREIPVAIQDRSFNNDGSLFYPDTRAFFDGFLGPYVPTSDIAPTWNPEAFFNTIVVNGTTWPSLEVAPALYRLRLLNGCNSRFLNLSLVKLHKKKDQIAGKLPFYQIGAEQGFLPRVVRVAKGESTPLPGDGSIPAPVPTNAQQALLMGLAERADAIVDFRNLPNGTVVRMINTAPDAPFGGFPDIPADPATTGQVMEFVVNAALNGQSPTDPLGATPATDPYRLALNHEPALGAAVNAGAPRKVSLNEEESVAVCWDGVNFTPDATPAGMGVCVDTITGLPLDPLLVFPVAPKAAKLGIVGPVVDPLTGLPVGVPLSWHDMTGASTPTMVTMADGVTMKMVHATETPNLNDIEEWDILNFTVDAHPIHLHLVRFEVVSRTLLDGVTPSPNGVAPSEAGYKDTVIAYPGEITRVKAKFDIAGLYVWHCHIVEHEDNEMMRPYVVMP